MVYLTFTTLSAERTRGVLINKYKLHGNTAQYSALDEAIRTVQFIRNKCLRKWMDGNLAAGYCRMVCSMVTASEK